MPPSYFDPYSLSPASGPWTGQPLPPPPLTIRLFGTDADALAARPATRLQGMLLRNVSLRYAVSKWFTSALGAIVALGAGLLLSLIAQALWAGSLADLVKVGDTLPPTQQSAISSVITEVKALLNSSLLNVFVMEHHVSLLAHYNGASSGESVTIDATLSLPFLGLLLAPALALTLGGYVAGSSDYHRVARYSIARGALLGPCYGLLLLMIALLSSSSVPLSDFLSDPTARGSITISPLAWQALLYGLLWGMLFGALGGWIQLRGRGFLAAALSSLQTLRRARLAGACAGAGVALCCGFLLFLAIIFAFTMFSGTTAAANAVAGPSGVPSANSLTNAWQVLRLLFVFGPAGAISLYALGAGGPYAYAITYTGVTTQANKVASDLGLINAAHTPTNSAFFLLMLVPAISYLAGGRVAARVARARLPGDAAVAGAALALPLSLLVALAGLLAGSNLSLTFTAAQTSGVDISAGPAFWGTLLAVLIGGAVIGGLGGASEVVLPRLGALPRLALLPLRPLGWLLFRVLDRLTARPAGQSRSAAERWLYDGVLVVVVFSVIVLVLYPLNSVLATSIPYPVLRGIDAWAAALLVGLPILFFTGALVTAFSAPEPQAVAALAGVSTGGGVVPGSPLWPPVSQPFSPGSMPGSVSQPSLVTTPGSLSQPFPTAAPSGSQPMYPATSRLAGLSGALPPNQSAPDAPALWPADPGSSQPMMPPGNSGAFSPTVQSPTPSQPIPPADPTNAPDEPPAGH